MKGLGLRTEIVALKLYPSIGGSRSSMPFNLTLGDSDLGWVDLPYLFLEKEISSTVVRGSVDKLSPSAWDELTYQLNNEGAWVAHGDRGIEVISINRRAGLICPISFWKRRLVALWSVVQLTNKC
jgi:hypothetical protein